jgi:molecular chaperone DnaK
MDIYVGIDLGTTESTLSVIEIESRKDKALDKLRALPIYQHDEKMAFDRDNTGLQSSIYIDRDNKRVYSGRYAKYLYASGNYPLNTIRSVKTRIGGESMIAVPLLANKQEQVHYDMTELSAVLLKTIKSSLDKQMSLNDRVINVTITIPAAFNSDERNATLEAAYLAGFQKINLLDEPTAVLLNYLNTKSSLDEEYDDLDFSEKKRILVYDIGGGTLDISVAEVLENDDGDFNVAILGRSKRMDFGGDDIDKYIAAYFLEEFEKLNPSIETRSLEDQAKIISRVVSNAERAKIELNDEIDKAGDNERRRSRAKKTVNFEIINGLKLTDIVINDEILRKILTDVISEYGELLSPIKLILKEVKLRHQDINLVLLTGGAGKFYLVNEVLNKFFVENVAIKEFTFRDAVSKGAAIHSYNETKEGLKKIDISDVMSSSIFIKKEKGFDKLISYNTTLGTRSVYNYTFNSSAIILELFLYSGSEGDADYKFKEINGIFHKLERMYQKGESIQLEWLLDHDKAIKIYFKGKELLTTGSRSIKKNELINDFSLNPIK